MDSDSGAAESEPPSGAPRAKLRRLDADMLTPHATPATLKEEAGLEQAAAVQHEELRRADVAEEARRALASLLRSCVASRPSAPRPSSSPRLRPPPRSPLPAQASQRGARGSTDSATSLGAEFGDALPECYHTAVRLSASLSTMADEDLACVAETCGVRFGARATRKSKVAAMMMRWAETAHTGRVEDAVCCLQLPDTAAAAAAARGYSGTKSAAGSDASVEREGEERVALRYVSPEERLCRYSVTDLQGFAEEQGIELPKNCRKQAKVEAILRQCGGIEEALLLYELSDMD